MTMLYRACGPYFFPLLVMNIFIVVFFVKSLIGRIGGKDLEEILPGINSILFWGIMAALTGILGQLSGIYSALTAIINAPEISPHVIAEGFTISFVSTLWGLVTLLFSALLWYFLKIKR